MIFDLSVLIPRERKKYAPTKCIACGRTGWERKTAIAQGRGVACDSACFARTRRKEHKGAFAPEARAATPPPGVDPVKFYLERYEARQRGEDPDAAPVEINDAAAEPAPVNFAAEALERMEAATPSLFVERPEHEIKPGRLGQRKLVSWPHGDPRSGKTRQGITAHARMLHDAGMTIPNISSVLDLLPKEVEKIVKDTP